MYQDWMEEYNRIVFGKIKVEEDESSEEKIIKITIPIKIKS